VRAGPGTGYARVGSLSYGTRVSIACQGYGSWVASSRIWDKISSPVAGWVSDWWVSTPNVGVFSPGYAQCSGAPSPAPSPIPPPTGTGKAPIATSLALLPGMVIATSCQQGSPDYVVVATGPSLLGIQLKLAKRWIVDQQSWDALQLPRSCIRIVTPAVLNGIPTSGWPLQMGTDITRGLPGVRKWVYGDPPSPLYRDSAGYCG
jgi:hypothetical protein